MARLAVVALGTLLATGCGNSTTTPLNTTSATSSTTTATVGSSQTTTTVTDGSTTASVVIPGASTSSSVKIVESTTPPSGVAALQSEERRAQSTAGTPVEYVSMTFAQTVTLPSLPAFTFTLGSISTGSVYELGFLDPTKASTYTLAAEGPGIVSGTTVAFTAPLGSVTFAGGTTYAFALYTTSLSPISPSASTLSFSALGASAAQTFTVAETGYAGAFTATSSSTSVATVSGPTGSPATFTVTPVGGGSATVTISDSNGQSATVKVSVTAATLVPQSKGL